MKRSHSKVFFLFFRQFYSGRNKYLLTEIEQQEKHILESIRLIFFGRIFFSCGIHNGGDYVGSKEQDRLSSVSSISNSYCLFYNVGKFGDFTFSDFDYLFVKK